MRGLRLTYVTLAATFLLIIVGGIVHATGSSLACPDWPLCYGEVFPSMRGGIFYEHSHRLLASGVGALAFALTLALLWRWQGDRRLMALGMTTLALELAQGLLLGAAVASPGPASPAALTAAWLLLTAVLALLLVMRGARDRLPVAGLLGFELLIVQALLGGLTVVWRLPPLVSTAHLATSLAFFATLVFLAFALRAGGRAPATALVPRGPIAVATMGVYFQNVLGALVRHTASGMACGDTILSCQGTWMPVGGPAHLNWTHRLFAVLVGVIVIAVSARALRQTRESDDARLRLVRVFGVGALGLVLAQVLLGGLMVSTHVSLAAATAHLGLATLLFVDLVALYIALGPLGRMAEREDLTHTTAAAQGAG